MEKHIKTLLFLASLLIFFVSCSSANDEKMSETSEIIANERDKMQPKSGITLPNLRYSGNVEFWDNKSENEYGIFFKDDNDLFNFIVLSDIGNTTTLPDGNYDIDVYENGITITSHTLPTKSYFFGLDSNKSRALLTDLETSYVFESSNVSAGSLLHNWGLGSIYDDKTIASAPIMYPSLIRFLNSFAVSGHNCQSGGVGSSSCSSTSQYGGCSITCKSGYHSCCAEATPMKAADCSCIKDVK
ncbi:hypothetical protein [Flavobacterium litorale]|uniref:Lipoprotein n=1 Tax=Flavobacterium litorale TaxID=2856519 RepID=A0ABX8VEM9_9FLAO|nr:hypothetical protein [Flavobacterium litorale]QYJ69099.1 hypothetical protein K1I41_04205 [Flavobacterium litorale]